MITLAQFRKLALSFPETAEEPHFEKSSFRVKKKIFATYDAKNQRATLKLSPSDQDVFSVAGSQVIYAVPNQWGKQGWTMVEMKKVKKELFTEVLKAAYCEVAPSKLAQLVKPDLSE